MHTKGNATARRLGRDLASDDRALLLCRLYRACADLDGVVHQQQQKPYQSCHCPVAQLSQAFRLPLPESKLRSSPAAAVAQDCDRASSMCSPVETAATLTHKTTATSSRTHRERDTSCGIACTNRIEGACRVAEGPSRAVTAVEDKQQMRINYYSLREELASKRSTSDVL
jgi:hypothetical protein